MDKHNIEDYLHHIGTATPSRGSGWRKMKCPWHDDSNASAAVNYEINRFKCHACGVQGDTYDLIMKDMGGTLVEAIEFASSISTSGDPTIRKSYRSGSGVSSNSGVNGRRSSPISLGRRGRSASGT